MQTKCLQSILSLLFWFNYILLFHYSKTSYVKDDEEEDSRLECIPEPSTDSSQGAHGTEEVAPEPSTGDSQEAHGADGLGPEPSTGNSQEAHGADGLAPEPSTSSSQEAHGADGLAPEPSTSQETHGALHTPPLPSCTPPPADDHFWGDLDTLGFGEPTESVSRHGPRQRVRKRSKRERRRCRALHKAAEKAVQNLVQHGTYNCLFYSLCILIASILT